MKRTRRPRRPSYQRLDYRVLHSSGKKSVVSSSESEDSECDNVSQDFSNPSNQLLDPLLISRFEELSCQSSSKIARNSASSLTTTIVASPETSVEVPTSETVLAPVPSSSVGESASSLVHSYQTLLTEEVSFEVSAAQVPSDGLNECSHLFPPKLNIYSGLEAPTSSLSDSFLETSLSEFATPLVNSTAFEFPEVDSNYKTERFLQDSTSAIINDQLLIKHFAEVAYYVCGIKKLIKPVLRSFHCQKSRHTMSISTSTDADLTQRALGHDIDDFIEEYPVDECETKDEVESCIAKMEDLRSLYRLRHSEHSKSIDNYDTSEQKTDYENRVWEVKSYLKTAKEQRKSLKHAESSREFAAQQKSSNFLIKEIDHIMSELSKEFDCHQVLKDDQITTKKAAIPQIEKKMMGVANSIKELLACKGDGLEEEVSRITSEYDQLCLDKSKYVQFIITEADSRELNKKELFHAGKLNIHLGKFSGFDSKSDIYTFQSEFNDLNQLTPKRYHARKLKNNHLDGPAHALVKNVDDIDDIWFRLKEAYGDSKLLLKKKLSEIESINDLGKTRQPEKVSTSLSKLINIIRDLLKLAADHGIEDKLYSGDGLDRIYQLMGDERLTKWLTHISEKNLSDKRIWTSLIEFLERDLKIQHQKLLIHHKKREEKVDEKSKKEPTDSRTSHHTNTGPPKCHLCGADDHVATNGPKGSKIVQYFACKKFAEINPHDRFMWLKDKGFCKQCLFPGGNQEKGKHKEGKCQRDFVCPDLAHEAHTVKKHVLICHEHRNSLQNQELLKTYKERFIDQRVELPAFSKEIKVTFLAQSFKTNSPDNNPRDDSSCNDDAIFLLQNILVDGEEYSIFYDNGCNQFVSEHDAVLKLGSRARQTMPGPIDLGGVGGTVAVAWHGEYEVSLPLFDGTNIPFTGLCLDQITQKFPVYPLQGAIEDDLNQAHNLTGDKRKLPRLPRTVGGLRTAFMMGVKFKKHFPKEIFMMPSGLSIFESQFRNPDGSRGIICGPHRLIAEIEASANMSAAAFFSQEFQLYRNGYKVNPDISVLHFRPDNALGDCFASNSKPLELFQSVEDAGSEILFRCNKCRDCKTCKHHENIDNMTVDQEAGQLLIEASITIDTTNQRIEATLPMICDPATKLPPSNRDTALRVYNRVTKQLHKSPQDKEDVIKAEATLQELGFVDFVSNLSKEDQQMLQQSPVKYIIPWRAVWKNSPSTPCRPVFDATFQTKTGYALNDILPKGMNSLNKLVEIIIRFYVNRVAFQTDIRKMYNTIHLDKRYWTFQRYIWQPELDPAKIPFEKIIKTIIYGLRPSGNQAEYALRQLAKLFGIEFPEICRIIHEDTYMDDCISGASSHTEVERCVEDLETVLNKGSFALKGIAKSGESPPAKLSLDGVHVGVGGGRWDPKNDTISFDIQDVNFAKKKRGKKETSSEGIVPEKLTRTHCASRTGEIFDISGKISPIVATFKLSLHELACTYKLKWDDVLPDNLRSVWCSHFEMMDEIKSLKFNRAVIPDDSVSVSFHTLDFGDASTKMICVAIYARFLRKNGEHSCQLLFSRTKIISPPMTQPRAELFASTVCTHTGEIVKRACKRFHERHLKITDSQVTLYWIHNSNKPLKQFVRNRVNEVRRFTDPNDWRYAKSVDMIADIGTRPVHDVSLVDQSSTWINGFPWMVQPEESFPFKTIHDIKLTGDEIEAVEKESLCSDWITERYQPDTGGDYDNGVFAMFAQRLDKAVTSVSSETTCCFSYFVNDSSSTDKSSCRSCTSLKNLCIIAQGLINAYTAIPTHVKAHYEYSQYLLDPNRFRFERVIRIMALVMRYVNNLRASVKQKRTLVTIYDGFFEKENPLVLTDEEISNAKNYYFRKATVELKHFAKPAEYESISKEENSILYYTGRILPTEKILDVREQMTDVMKDLSATTFCVPLIHKHSPLAYSIVNEVHWYSSIAQHSGIETVWRYVLQIAYIIGGRSVVKKVNLNCVRCRFLRKKFIDVEMGPMSEHNLTIAPAFYSSQVDLCGPFTAYDPTGKRKSLKIWLAVFCCCTTATVNIKVMEDYSTSSFIFAFIRFSTDCGFPKHLQVDHGSQLVKGCESMKLTFVDVKNRLHRLKGVNFDIVPVGGHNFNGKVERRIRQIKESIEKSIHNERLSTIQWETMGSQIANSVNDLPLALGNLVADYEFMDLLTPNRLKLGRNNDRAPVFPVETEEQGNLQRVIDENNRIFRTWFDVWLISHVPKLMDQPKWFKTDRDIKICDIVLMLKQEGELCSIYQYGMVHELEKDKDGITRKVQVKYRNSTENQDRFTWRAVRNLVIIHPVNELSIMEEMARSAHCCSQ